MRLAGKLVSGTSVVSIAVLLAAGQSPPQQQTAAQRFKNIQVLKDIPAGELLPAMQYITVALGVRCSFCHVERQFEKDDKPEKQTARKMITMLLAIDNENFNGRREVTCYTCHHGSARPMGNPPVAGNTSATNTPPLMGMPGSSRPGVALGAESGGPSNSTSQPSVEQIVAHYTQALGGQSTIDRLTSITESGTLEGSQGMHASITVERKSPDKVLTQVKTPMGEMVQGYDGRMAWERNPRGVQEQSGSQLQQAKHWAQFYPAINLQQGLSRVRVTGPEKIDDHEAYVVIGFGPAGPQRFFFDTQSGLLLRSSLLNQTVLGGLPQQTDYEDYRDINGVKIPSTLRIAGPEATMTYHFDQITANAPLEDAHFEMPATGAGRPTAPADRQ